jgi:D-alanyl-D-alanine carboxypeptidase
MPTRSDRLCEADTVVLAAAVEGRPRTGARGRRVAAGRSTILVALAVVVLAVIGAVGYGSSAGSSGPVAPDGAARPATAAGPEPPIGPVDGARRRHPPPGGEVPRGDRGGAVGEADGVVPDGVTVFDDVPAVTNLDPALLAAIRRAASDAADGGVAFSVNSGWRSPAYQDQLLREAIAKYGSEQEAARWVSTAKTSLHVSGHAIDIGPTDATVWLSRHGADYGLCQIYRNEPWHYELRPDAVDDGCPPLYADPTHDPRMQK